VTEPEGLRITSEEIDAATERFKGWVATLPEEEQRVFGWILTRAASAENESAARYAMNVGGDVPIDRLVSEAAGAGQGASGSEVRGFTLPRSIGPIRIWKFRW
jgi:hypothetical protein